MSIGRRLKRWRVERELTQREAAALAGISQPTWHAVETGTVKRLSGDVAAGIVAATDNAFTLADFFPAHRKAG